MTIDEAISSMKYDAELMKEMEEAMEEMRKIYNFTDDAQVILGSLEGGISDRKITIIQDDESGVNVRLEKRLHRDFNF